MSIQQYDSLTLEILELGMQAATDQLPPRFHYETFLASQRLTIQSRCRHKHAKFIRITELEDNYKTLVADCKDCGVAWAFRPSTPEEIKKHISQGENITSKLT